MCTRTQITITQHECDWPGLQCKPTNKHTYTNTHTHTHARWVLNSAEVHLFSPRQEHFLSWSDTSIKASIVFYIGCVGLLFINKAARRISELRYELWKWYVCILLITEVARRISGLRDLWCRLTLKKYKWQIKITMKVQYTTETILLRGYLITETRRSSRS